MSKKLPYPGAKCRIIGSANGPKGPSVGRECIAMFAWDGPPHTLWGQIWRVSALPGQADFVSEHGGKGREVDCAEDWLEVIDDDPSADLRQTDKTLEVH